MKNIGIAALAALLALVLGLSAGMGTQTADAETEGILLIGCELIAGGIDGDLDDDTVAGDFFPCFTGMTPTDLENLDATYGDDDGTFELEDLEERATLDGNQIAESCTAADVQCTMLVFVSVDDEAPVELDLPSGLANAQNGLQDFICTDEGGSALTTDNDCTDGTNGGPGADNNGDGIVVFHVINGTGDAGDDFTVRVEQENVEQTDDVLIVGDADEVEIAVVEDVIQTNGSTSAAEDCAEGGSDIGDAANELGEPEKTLVIVTVTDNDGTELARVSIYPDDDLDVNESGTVSSDDEDVAIPATSDPSDATPSGTSSQTVVTDAGTAFFQIICGGPDTGVATITAWIDDGGTGEDASVDITVVGEPDAIALTASPATIACDGTQTSTVTATVTDSEGNNVADGTSVNFSVVALGTANPINAETTDGVATSVITPLSNASAGVTVIVTAGGDQDTAASIRVDCSIPIPPQPTTGPAATPTRPGGVIGGPDTGSGGYLGQDSSAGFPLWTLVALGLGSVALVAGGLVTRKVSK